jgi:hypothetical protein
MQSAMARKIGLGGVALAVLAAAACNRDGRDFGRGISSPASSLREGARLTATLSDRTELRAPGRQPELRRSGPTTVEAVVRGGVAVPDSSGIPLATSRVLGAASRRYSFTSPDGKAHEMVLTAPDGRSPVSRVQHFVDGELTIEVHNDWVRGDAGWTLKGRTITVYRNGQPVSRQHREVGPVEVSRVEPAEQLLGRFRGLAGALLPRPLLAQRNCNPELERAGIAATALIAAVDAYIRDPLDPFKAAAVVIAYVNFNRAWTDLEVCMGREFEEL